MVPCLHLFITTAFLLSPISVYAATKGHEGGTIALKFWECMDWSKRCVVVTITPTGTCQEIHVDITSHTERYFETKEECTEKCGSLSSGELRLRIGDIAAIILGCILFVVVCFGCACCCWRTKITYTRL